MEKMKIKVTSKKQNPILRRMEISFKVEQEKTKGTPTRLKVREMLATALNVNKGLLYIKKMETKTGSMTTVGEANVYDSSERAKLVEPKYIIARNTAQVEPEEEKG